MSYRHLNVPEHVHDRLMVLKQKIDGAGTWKTTVGNLLAHVLDCREVLFNQLMETIDRSASAREVVFDIHYLQDLFSRSPNGTGTAGVKQSYRASKDRKLSVAIELERKLGMPVSSAMVIAYLDAQHDHMRDGGERSVIEEISEEGLDQN